MSLSEINRPPGPMVRKESWVGVVDDDASLRIALGRALRGSGIRVEVFASAEDFLFRDIPGDPDCLVLDIHLGGMSGFALQQRLASDGVAPPIIFITAHEDMFAAATRCSGACGYLRKPFDTNALLALIQPHLSADMAR